MGSKSIDLNVCALSVLRAKIPPRLLKSVGAGNCSVGAQKPWLILLLALAMSNGRERFAGIWDAIALRSSYVIKVTRGL
jgi:hypothetical protein